MKHDYTCDVWNESENIHRSFKKYLIATAFLHCSTHFFNDYTSAVTRSINRLSILILRTSFATFHSPTVHIANSSRGYLRAKSTLNVALIIIDDHKTVNERVDFAGKILRCRGSVRSLMQLSVALLWIGCSSRRNRIADKKSHDTFGDKVRTQKLYTVRVRSV